MVMSRCHQHRQQDTDQLPLFAAPCLLGDKQAPAVPFAIALYRVALVRETSVPLRSARVGTSSVAATIVRDYLAHVDREHFMVLLLNRKNMLIGMHIVSVGSLTASVVHPREVFKAAILGNAAAMICGHNHPSGDPQPSQEDRALTARLGQGGKLPGIDVLDHVIVGDGTAQYFSFADQGLLYGGNG
jgi:DNA repair protein RadC